MAITSFDQLLNALGNNSSRFLIDKASVANTVAGNWTSLWRATGMPPQAAIPTSPAICTKSLLGAIDFTNQTAPATSYLAWMWANFSLGNTALEIHDRLAHCGGLVLNSTSAQTISGFDLSTLGGGISAERRGASNYSDVTWFLECYTDGGATASNATINVTFNDGTTGNLAVVAVGGTLRAGRSIPLVSNVAGKFIRGVNSVTLSASTGTAGNFGITATRQRTSVVTPSISVTFTWDWARLGFPEIPNDACLALMVTNNTTSTGLIRGQGKIAHG